MKTSRRALAALAVTLGAAVALAGCSAGGTGSAKKQLTIGVVLSDATNPYFQTMGAQIKKDAAKDGIKIIERDAPNGTDTQTYNGNVDSLVALHVDGLLLAPISSSDLQAAKRAVAAKIPIVQLDSAIPGFTSAVSTVVTDNVQAGKDSMNLLIDGLKKAKKPANVILVNNTLGYQSVNDRTKGAEEAVKTAGANLVKVVNGGTSASDALSSVQTVLQGNADVDGVMGTVSIYSIAAIQAVKAAGRSPSQVLITGVDGSAQEFKAIKAGDYYGTAAQLPAKIGSIGLTALVDHIHGKKVKSSILIQPVKVTAANVKEFSK